MEQNIDELVPLEYARELNPFRLLAYAIVHLLTKEQINTLKSRLQFNPRKLPLNMQALIDAIQQGDEDIFALLHHRYSQLFKAFEVLVLPEQLENLHGYAKFVFDELKQTSDDLQREQLEELHFLLRMLIDNAENGRNSPSLKQPLN